MIDELTRLGGRQCGVFTFAQAEAAGYTRAQIHRHVEQRHWVRLRRNAYVHQASWQAAAGDPRRLHRMRVAAVLLDNPRAAASHTSAARLLEVSHLWSWPEFVTITVEPPPGRKLSPNHTGVVSRRVGQLPNDHVATQGILRYTTAARTLVDLARELGFAEAVVVADDLLHRGLTTKEEARAVFEAMTQWRKQTVVDRVLELADGRSESVLESYGRVQLHLNGISGGEPQVWLYGADGPIGRVDLFFRERRTVVEFDGLVKYDGDEGALRREKLRQERLERAGFAVVRATFNDVRYEPARTAVRVAAGFERAALLPRSGWPGPAPDWAVA